MQDPIIAVTNNALALPADFPISRVQNSGNLIHGTAPVSIFPGAFSASGNNRPWGEEGFRAWVNDHATHIIFTQANTIRLDRKGDRKRDRSNVLQFIEMLDSFTPKLVIFGLGAQAPTVDLSELEAAPEMVKLMKYLGDRCEVVGVRGEFTKKVFSYFADVNNTFVTGCPSMFSRPEKLKELESRHPETNPGVAAFSATSYRRRTELNLLLKAIEADHYLIEPSNAGFHKAFLDSTLHDSEVTPPKEIEHWVEEGQLSLDRMRDYFGKRYRLFRHAETWYDFNQELVSFTYGSRFHVNMASFLSGVPALWFTHDSRTIEMAEFLHLPSIDLDAASDMTYSELIAAYNPEPFLENIESKFANFNEYLRIFDLQGLTFKW